MLNRHTQTVSAECVRCHGGEILPLEPTCLLCDGYERVTVTVSGDGPDSLNDAAVDAMYEMEIAKGLRAPDISEDTANYFNALVRK